jgi:hypothetical protein
MPQERELPDIEAKGRPITSDDVPLRFAEDHLQEWYALQLVKTAFSQYEAFRMNSHDPRWNLNDMLYASYVPQRNWPGSDMPRSSLGLSIVFEQVEGAIPNIAQALFSNPEWFAVEADIGAEPQAARAQQAHLEYAFDKTSEKRGTTPNGELLLALKDVLLYGNGGVAVEYDPDYRMAHFYKVDVRDVYFDPFCSVPSVEGSRSVIWRRWMTLEEVRSFRNDPRMKVPDDAQLWKLAQQYPAAQADFTKQTGEAVRGVQFSPQWTATASTLPTHNQIEILVYYSRERIIWVIGREAVMFNSRNPYGFIPLCFAPCYVWPGRFHAMSIADAQEGYQRYIEALFNARLDQKSLNLFPPRWVPRGFLITPQQQKWGPGAQFGVDDPKGVNFYTPGDSDNGIYQELGFIQAAADRKTGLNQMAMSGSMPNAASGRTAAGVNAQMQGAQMRLYTIIKNFEDYLIIPLVQKAIRITRVHAEMGRPLPGKARNPNNPEEEQYVQVSAQAFMQASRVRVTAASKMLTRDRLSQQFPFVAQTLLSGPFMGALNQAGQTVDFQQFTRMLMDATGVDRYYQIIRPLSEEEKAEMKRQQEEQANAGAGVEMQKAQMDAQTRLQMGQMKVQSESEKRQTELQVAQMKSKADPNEAIMKQQEMQQKMAADRESAQMDMYKKMVELQMKQKELEMKIQAERVKMQQSVQKAQIDSQVQMQQADSEARIQQFRHAQQMQQESERARLEHENTEESNRLSMDHQTSMNKIKQRTALKMGDRGRPTSKSKE